MHKQRLQYIGTAKIISACSLIWVYLLIRVSQIFQPARLFNPARLLNFWKIPPCSLIKTCSGIRQVRVHAYKNGYILGVRSWRHDIIVLARYYIPLGWSMMLKKIAVDPFLTTTLLRTALTRQGSTAIYSPTAQYTRQGSTAIYSWVVH